MSMFEDPFHRRRSHCAARFLLAGLLLAASRLTAGIPEPETVFYGRIVNRTSGQEYLMVQGNLAWVIRKPDGQPMQLTAALTPLKDGEFSYRINVPHEALSSGLTVSSSSVPLPSQNATCSLLQISVDGAPARIMAPGESVFDVAQTTRATTHRLDLEVFTALPDANGDGIPDWWEDKYGQDDAMADTDADGLNNLAEFLGGSNPTEDNRIPTLETRELLVYGDGSTGMRLRAIDSDSQPSDLVYAVSAPPNNGTLFLRNTGSAAHPDQALATGDTFTQNDVNDGRLIFVCAAGGTDSSFGVSLRDENPAHPAADATVSLTVYRPDASLAGSQLDLTAGPLQGVSGAASLPVDELQLLSNYLLSRDAGFVVWDASRESRGQTLRAPSSALTAADYLQSYVPAHGPDRKQVFVGGTGNDDLSGSMESDVLAGGPGNDQLRGNGGADFFLFTGPQPGQDTVEDFDLLADTLDLSHLFSGSSSLLSDYLQVASAGNDSVLHINLAGAGATVGYNDASITLAGVNLQAADLYLLVDSGHLLVGNKQLPTRIDLVADLPVASENGPTAGSVTLVRSGWAGAGLTVNLQITGSAINGVDYAWLPAQVVFAPNQRMVSIAVAPYADAIIEPSESVQIMVQPGSGYAVGATGSGTVTIEDLAPLVSVEAVQPVAVLDTQRPGMILLRRSGVLDRTVIVRLRITGTASSGSDYAPLPSFVELASGQASYQLAVVPSTSAVLANGAESVRVTIVADPSYKLGDPASAGVSLVDHEMSFAGWAAAAFPGATTDLASFAGRDEGGQGIVNLLRYAFQLDPNNPSASMANCPKFEIQGDRFTVSFHRFAAATDLRYIVEASNDLRTWHATPDFVEPFLPAGQAEDSQMDTAWYRTTPYVSEANPMYLRVRVVYAP